MTTDAVTIYPLRMGEMLSNLDWWPFYGHKFEQSEFVLRAVNVGRLDWIGAGVCLWNGALRQDPAGAIIDDDMRLAHLARCGVDQWVGMRAEVLRGWLTVLVEVPGGDTVERITHPQIMAVAEEQIRRKRGFDVAKRAANDRKKRERIRRQLQAMRVREAIITDQTIGILLGWFNDTGLYVTADNLRMGLTDVVGIRPGVAILDQRREQQND